MNIIDKISDKTIGILVVTFSGLSVFGTVILVYFSRLNSGHFMIEDVYLDYIFGSLLFIVGGVIPVLAILLAIIALLNLLANGIISAFKFMKYRVSRYSMTNVLFRNGDLRLKPSLHLVISILLFIGIFDMPNGFYQFLRISVTLFGIYLIIDSHKNYWKIAFIILSILYNPIIQISLDKDIWQIVNGLTIVLILTSFMMNHQTKNLENSKN